MSVRHDARATGFRLKHETTFLRSWFGRPLTTGAVTPSGRALANSMAAPVEPGGSGPVIELGPGTGPVTEALLRRGVAPERLLLVEYSPEFTDMLRQRFPDVTVVRGDAYDIRATLKDALSEPAAAIVSSLPLLTKPVPQRVALLEACFDLARPGAPFVQFTYGVPPPVPLKGSRFTATPRPRVWWNLPPARVWVYKRPAE